jgi:L-ascorbate metabolism protein UlaG (beta-lactamase superfamily)
MDPFDETVGYRLPAVRADVVTVSHEHFDHGNVGVVQGSPQVLKGVGEHSIRGARFRGIQTYHDEQRGAKRGTNTVFVIEMKGITFCHLGDLGHIPSDDAIDSWGRVDVMMAPVGGVYTIDAAGALMLVRRVKPRVVIPMHYKTPSLKFPLAGPEEFLRGIAQVQRPAGREYIVSADRLPAETTAVVLRYQ